MTIKFYKNLSEKNHLDKDIHQQGSDVTGTLREECSVIDPVIKIESFTSFDLTTCNYAYITEFERYYFINNIVLKGNLFEVHMHVDVLSTYKDVIRSNSAVISRQEKQYNLYLRDGAMKTYANPHIQVSQFPNGFTDYNFIFSVAG